MCIETLLPEMFCWVNMNWSRLEILASQKSSLKERRITVSERMGTVQCSGVFIQYRRVFWWFLTWLWTFYFLLSNIGMQLSVWRRTNFPLPLMFGPSGSHCMRSSLTATVIRALKRYWFNGNSLLWETDVTFLLKTLHSSFDPYRNLMKCWNQKTPTTKWVSCFSLICWRRKCDCLVQRTAHER